MELRLGKLSRFCSRDLAAIPLVYERQSMNTLVYVHSFMEVKCGLPEMP
jgi:hypothetical protein